MRIYRSCQPVGYVRFAGTEHNPIDNLSVEQPTLQAALLNLAVDRNVDIHYGCELLEVTEHKHSVSVTMRDSRGVFKRDFRYLIGADGSHSTTRQQLGITFEGDVDPNISFVADCVMRSSLSLDEMHYFVAEGGQRLAVIPLSSENRRFKLSGNLPRDFHTNASPPEIEIRLKELVGTSLEGQLYLERIENFSPYRLASRLASSFATARCFLVGDAARICLPNGGWGLNSAIADAANLAWKLAGTIAGWCDVRVLESYGSERRAASEKLLDFTKRQRAAAFSDRESEEQSEESFSPVLSADGLAILESSEMFNDTFPSPGSSVFETWPTGPGHPMNGSVGGKFSIFTSNDRFIDEKCGTELMTTLAKAGLPINEDIHLWPRGSHAELGTKGVVVVRPDGVVGAIGSNVSACLGKYFSSLNSNAGLNDVAS